MSTTSETQETSPKKSADPEDGEAKTQSLAPGSKEWCKRYPDTRACKIIEAE